MTWVCTLLTATISNFEDVCMAGARNTAAGGSPRGSHGRYHSPSPAGIQSNPMLQTQCTYRHHDVVLLKLHHASLKLFDTACFDSGRKWHVHVWVRG